jgi:hypothetical protein
MDVSEEQVETHPPRTIAISANVMIDCIVVKSIWPGIPSSVIPVTTIGGELTAAQRQMYYDAAFAKMKAAAEAAGVAATEAEAGAAATATD